MNWLKKKWIAKGREEMLSEMIDKFAELHSEYYSTGDVQAAELVVELVAYLQNDDDAQVR